jgi:phenylacetate-CoA ligase
MYSFLYRNLLFPAYDRLKSHHIYPKYKYLLNTQYFSRVELDKLINHKLEHLLKWSLETVPFYANYFETHNINSFDKFDYKKHLKLLPIINKSTIIENPDQFTTSELKKLKIKRAWTSGSSGKQLGFIKDSNTIGWAWASMYRHYNWAGVKMGEKEVLLWGRFDKNAKPGFKNKVSEKIKRRIKLNAYLMSEEKMSEYAKFIAKYKPSVLRGYASALYSFANYCKNNGVYFPSLKAISSTSDQLTDNMKSFIQDVFGIKVYNQYACGEVLGGAYECDQGEGLHIIEEHNLIEVDAPEGEVGDIVVTDLDNYAMPFLRYKNGDRGIIDSQACSCGRVHRRIKKVVGRTEEFITTDDNRILNTTFFSPFFSKFNEVSQFQIIQKELKQFEILITININDDAYKTTLENGLKSIIGESNQFVFRYNQPFHLINNQKYQVIISELQEKNKHSLK